LVERRKSRGEKAQGYSGVRGEGDKCTKLEALRGRVVAHRQRGQERSKKKLVKVYKAHPVREPSRQPMSTKMQTALADAGQKRGRSFTNAVVKNETTRTSGRKREED